MQYCFENKGHLDSANGTEAIGGDRNAPRNAVKCFLCQGKYGKQLFPKRKRLGAELLAELNRERARNCRGLLGGSNGSVTYGSTYMGE
jgi:hypothetical protein